MTCAFLCPLKKPIREVNLDQHILLTRDWIKKKQSIAKKKVKQEYEDLMNGLNYHIQHHRNAIFEEYLDDYSLIYIYRKMKC